MGTPTQQSTTSSLQYSFNKYTVSNYLRYEDNVLHYLDLLAQL